MIGTEKRGRETKYERKQTSRQGKKTAGKVSPRFALPCTELQNPNVPVGMRRSVADPCLAILGGPSESENGLISPGRAGKLPLGTFKFVNAVEKAARL